MAIFPIKSGVGDNLAAFTMTMPNTEWFKSAFLGALFLLTDPENWVELGDVDVSFATEEAAKMLANFTYEEI